MARCNFVKKARKDRPQYGIKKGESYYWWQFRFGGVYVSKIQPRRSQLTQSDFLGQVYDLEDRLSDIDTSMDIEDIQGEIESIAEEIRNLGSECEDRRSNMPEQLQDSGSGEILQNRVDSCEEWASNLDGIDFDIDEELKIAEKIDELEERKQEIIDEIQGYSYEGE